MIFAVFQFNSRQRADRAELEAQLQDAESRKSASGQALKSLEVPTRSFEPTTRAAAAGSGVFDAKRLEVQVLDPADVPVADAKIMLFLGATVIADGATDASGVAQFVPLDGTGSYLLDAPGWEPVLGDLELGAGRRTVRLAEGAVIAGTVIVDGVAPIPPVDLTWTAQRLRSVQELPAEITLALRDARKNVFSSSVSTDADGNFMFHGLAGDAAGLIRWPDTYSPELSAPGFFGNSLEVAAPRRDLVIRLVAGVSVRLRVVTATGLAVPNPMVSLKYGSSTTNPGRLRQRARP